MVLSNVIVDVTIPRRAFVFGQSRKKLCSGHTFVCLGSLILSFTYNFFAYFKFHSNWGRIIGKIKQKELDCCDTGPLMEWAYNIRNPLCSFPDLFDPLQFGQIGGQGRLVWNKWQAYSSTDPIRALKKIDQWETAHILRLKLLQKI